MFTSFRKAALLQTRVSQAVQSALDTFYDGVTVLMRGEGPGISDEKGGTLTITGAPSIETNPSIIKVGSGVIKLTEADTILLTGRPEYRMPGDFTLEFWMHPTAYPSVGGRLLQRWATSTYPAYGMNWQTDGRLHPYWGNAVNGVTGGLVHFNTSVIPLNKWTHIVQQRRNGITEFYIDGVLFTSSTFGQQDSNVSIGITVAEKFTGYLDQIRLSNGVARYKGNFTPPVEVFKSDGPDPYYDKVTLLMHMNGDNGSTEFKDELGHTFTPQNGAQLVSLARAAFGNSAGDFRTGGWLSTPHAADLSLGGHNFTVEGFFQLPDFSTTPIVVGKHYVLMQKGTIAGSNFEYSLSILGYSATQIQLVFRYSINGTAITGTLTSNTMAYSTLATAGWHHWAMVRDGLTLRFYMDGVARGSGSFNAISNGAIFSGNGNLSIGAGPTGSDNYQIGCMDEIRVTKGIARYPLTFTAPTKEFVQHPVTHTTELLLHFDDAAVNAAMADSSPMTKAVAQVALTMATDAKFGTHCIALTGGSTECLYSQHPRFQLGANDFTFEFFIKASQSVNTSPGAIIAMIDTVNNDLSNGGTYGGLTINANGVHVSLDGVSWSLNSTNMPLGQGVFNTGNWVHLAIVRVGARFLLFINGVKTRDVSVGNAPVYPRSAGRLQLGSSNAINGTYVCKLDEVRFSNKAVYTADFTPPAMPFTE